MTDPVKVPLATKPMSILQSLASAQRNVLSILPEIATRQRMVSGKTGIRWHMVMDPTALKRVLRDNLANYPKSGVTKTLLRSAIGNSLFIAEGAHWQWQRRATAPTFALRNVRALGPVMTRAAEATCDRLNATSGRPSDIYAQMVTTTFQVISDVTLSGDSEFDPQTVHKAIDAYIASAGRVTLADILGLPGWVPRGGWFKSRKALADMRRIADATIEARRRSGPRETPDLLDHLLAAQDPETGRKMTTPELRDNLLTFIVAGHETTALTLSWALYLCAFDPEHQEKARAEAQSVLNARAATQDDLTDLTYTTAIIEEALRLYPPAALVSRTAQSNDKLCGRQISPGDTVMIPIYTLHRHHMLWDDPDAFWPERFMNSDGPERFAYLPFGDGPRICIGQSFAMQEAVIILATLLSRFKFSLTEKRPEPVMILTLRPEGGVWLHAKPL